MSQLITLGELQGMNEEQLRGLYGRIISDLRRTGQAAQDCPHIYASLRNIEAAIHRLQQPRPKPKPPRF